LDKKTRELFEKAKRNPKGLRFSELQRLCKGIGMMHARTKGSHLIYTMEGLPLPISIQKTKDGKAKPFQVRQVLAFIEENDLAR